MEHTQRNALESSQPCFQLVAIPEVLRSGHQAVQQSAASRHIGYGPLEPLLLENCLEATA
jgi:hypothetical protein